MDDRQEGFRSQDGFRGSGALKVFSRNGNDCVILTLDPGTGRCAAAMMDPLMAEEIGWALIDAARAPVASLQFRTFEMS